MRTIIAGSRTINDYRIVWKAVTDCGWVPTQVVCGTAAGVDTVGERYAYHHNIPVRRFPAEWDKYGKSAGYKRNIVMSENADALILVWDGESRGSAMMKAIAQRKGLRIFEVIVPR